MPASSAVAVLLGVKLGSADVTACDRLAAAVAADVGDRELAALSSVDGEVDVDAAIGVARALVGEEEADELELSDDEEDDEEDDVEELSLSLELRFDHCVHPRVSYCTSVEERERAGDAPSR